MEKVNKVLCDLDSMWIKRRRKLNTLAVYNSITTAHSMGCGTRAVAKCIAGVSSPGLVKAIDKMTENIFKIALERLNTVNRPKKVYAFDGSWFRMPPSFKNFDRDDYKIVHDCSVC